MMGIYTVKHCKALKLLSTTGDVMDGFQLKNSMSVVHKNMQSNANPTQIFVMKQIQSQIGSMDKTSIDMILYINKGNE